MIIRENYELLIENHPYFESLNKIMKGIDKTFQYRIVIGHARCLEEGNRLKSLFEKNVELFQQVDLLEIGGALGVHAGPGALSGAYQKIDD